MISLSMRQRGEGWGEGPVVANVARVVRSFTRLYYRLELRGAVPDGPCLLVGNHNFGAYVNPEIYILGSHVPGLKQLAHDLLFKVPGVRSVARHFGAIPAKHEDALRALREGHRVAVFPGGAWESFRPSSQRDVIDFKGRSGFVRLAREAGVPIVPVVTAGGHDGWHIVTRGEGIARALGLNRFRIDVFPIGFAAPFGLLIGPTPFMPLPHKIICDIGQPMHDVTDADQVVSVMQAKLNELTRELRS